MQNDEDETTSVVMDLKKQVLLNKLQQRHQERTEKRREANEDKESSDVLIEHFWNDFNDKLNHVNYSVDTIDENVNILNQLQQSLNTHIHLLKSYDVKQAQEKLKQLETNIEQSRNEKLKGKKFSFSSRTKKNTITTSTTTTSTPPPSDQSSIVNIKAAKTFSGVKDLNITNIDNDEDLLITDCNDTSITMHCIAGAVYFKNLHNCTVTLGPVKSSVFVQNCDKCVFTFGARQIRIHTSQDCTFFIYTKSNPIIEHCSKIQFGVYNAQYNGVKEQFDSVNFDLENNTLWKEVKDFNWMKSTPSPNWSIVC
jgi:flagellar biosynthesis/type III secretory pathway chaperone